MNKLSLKMKLGVGFGLLLLIMATMGMVSYYSVRKLGDLSEVADKQANARFLATSILAIIIEQQSEVRGFLLMGNEREMQAYEQNNSKLAEHFSSIDPLMTTEEGKRLMAELHQSSDAYHAGMDQLVALHRSGKRKEALDTVSSPKFAELRTAAKKAATDFMDLQNTLKRRAREEQAATESRTIVLVISLAIAGIVISFVAATLVTRSITGAIARMVTLIQQIAANNLTIEDMQITSQDEIGKAGAALNQMKNSLHAVIQSIAETAQHVASASEELSATSQQISANSEETSAQVNVVNEATKQVSQNLQSVSTGSEEMTSTIQSIAGNAHEAATVASRAVETAQAANATVAKLGESSAEIGEVIKVITSIAQQTNLLALNATIEAARAGEAGKGFAVVANEVKELAKQTAKATEDISQKITAIQQDTKGAVDAIGSITGVITQVNEISGTIATAVEEQSATTNEMTRNVADAAKGAGEISHNIEGVAQAAQGTSTSAQESQKAADELAQMAEQLRGLVGQFKIDGRQASANRAATVKPRALAASAGK